MDTVIPTTGGGIKPPPQIFTLSPRDNPDVWLSNPAYKAPSDVDVERCQREIDSMTGTARGNESIIKLVWNGDRRYWLDRMADWESDTFIKRPHVRYKALRKDGKLVRDVFPARWLLLARLEPEQYPNYEAESYVMVKRTMRDAEGREYTDHVRKCIRPPEPPKVYWLWFAMIAEHNDYCCTIAQNNDENCFGKYAPPQAGYPLIKQQMEAEAALNVKRSPYASLDGSAISAIEAQMNGYENELKKMEIESNLFLENPLALLGPRAMMAAGIDTPKKAQAAVKEFFDRKIQETADTINRLK